MNTALQLLVLPLLAESSPIESLSFAAPFESVNSEGKRVVPSFPSTGHTEIHRNFIRLTPDRQSKQGTLWSDRAFEPAAAEFSAALTFRISGQASRWFGDGIGWWFTTAESDRTGPLHGAADVFTGFGVVIDTFENAESAAHHNDVTIFVNNGTRTLEEMQVQSFGCNPSTKMRFHEKRADFSWGSSSRVAVSVKDGQLSVSVDERNSGTWTECVAKQDLNLPASFFAGDQVRVGLSASTGGVADNHDVLAMSSFTHAEEATSSVAASTDSTPTDAVAELRHHVEHELVHMKESMGNTIGKLQQAEKDAEGRIQVLEESVRTKVLEETNQKLMEMVLKLQRQEENSHERIVALEHRLSNLLNQSIERQSSSIEQVHQRLLQTQQQTASWQTPFVLLVMVLAGSGYGAHSWYQGMRKQHLL